MGATHRCSGIMMPKFMPSLREGSRPYSAPTRRAKSLMHAYAYILLGFPGCDSTYMLGINLIIHELDDYYHQTTHTYRYVSKYTMTKILGV